ncbi:MAG: hypothetical protein JWR21_2168 [Herminiimonas sp.]|nr:hypothetical protein [Herminiimonas sp.]MDB5853438.1 hypothetical protein [Herminiimonas sp.]
MFGGVGNAVRATRTSARSLLMPHDVEQRSAQRDGLLVSGEAGGTGHVGASDCDVATRSMIAEAWRCKRGRRRSGDCMSDCMSPMAKEVDSCCIKNPARLWGGAGFFFGRCSLLGGRACYVMPLAMVPCVVLPMTFSVMPGMVPVSIMTRRLTGLVGSRRGRWGISAQLRCMPFHCGGTCGVGATGYAGRILSESRTCQSHSQRSEEKRNFFHERFLVRGEQPLAG